MVIDKTIFQTNAPSHSDVIWAKPEEDKITLHMYNRGKWMPVSGAIGQDVKKTYPVDPRAELLTNSTFYRDIVSDGLVNAVKSKLNIDHDAPYSDEELQAMDKVLLSKINDDKYRTKDHGMATATAFDMANNDLVFTCDDGTLFFISSGHSSSYEFQRKEPFSVTLDGVHSAALIVQAKVLGVDIDKYLPDMALTNQQIDNAWGSIDSNDEYYAAIDKVNNELKSMQYITEEHGSAELKVIYGYIDQGSSFLFKCEDGTVIQVLGSMFVKEHLPAPDYTRFQLVNDLYGSDDWEYSQDSPYVIVDTKDTEGKITEEVMRNQIIGGIPDLTTLHNYTDTIYMPAEAILLKVDNRIEQCSSFFKLYWVNKDNIGIPSDIQAIIDNADQEVDPNAYLITEQTTIFDSFLDKPLSTIESQSYRTLSHGKAVYDSAYIAENPNDSKLYFTCSDGWEVIVEADGTTFNENSGGIKKAPTLKVSGGNSSTSVSIWKTTVRLSDDTLAYIFMTISTESNRSTPFGVATISMSPLYFSDNSDYISKYGPQE